MSRPHHQKVRLVADRRSEGTIRGEDNRYRENVRIDPQIHGNIYRYRREQDRAGIVAQDIGNNGYHNEQQRYQRQRFAIGHRLPDLSFPWYDA